MNIHEGGVALITGAGSGIGRALALECRKRGMRLALLDINQRRLDNLVAEMGCEADEALKMRFDLSNVRGLDKQIEKITEKFGNINLLINNAAVLHVAPIDNYLSLDWEWVLKVNLLAPVVLSSRILGLMKNSESGGAIVNISSVAAFNFGAGLAGYKISKSALLHFSELMISETEDSNVHVMAVCPGWTDTNLMSSEIVRPKKYRIPRNIDPHLEAHRENGRQKMRAGDSPTDIARIIMEGLESKEKYILMDDGFLKNYQLRNSRLITQLSLKTCR